MLLKRSFREVNRLCNHLWSIVPTMFVTLVLGCGRYKSSYELVMGVVAAYRKLMVLVDRIQPQVLTWHSVCTWDFRINL